MMYSTERVLLDTRILTVSTYTGFIVPGSRPQSFHTILQGLETPEATDICPNRVSEQKVDYIP